MSDTHALILFILIVGLVLAHWHHSDDNFDLRWVVVDSNTGKVSLFKLGQAVALVVSTWVLIHETRRGHLTEWLFGLYMLAWAGANIANKVTEKYKSLEPTKETQNGNSTQ